MKYEWYDMMIHFIQGYSVWLYCLMLNTKTVEFVMQNDHYYYDIYI